jgi:hypothetical protein
VDDAKPEKEAARELGVNEEGWESNDKTKHTQLFLGVYIYA